MICINNTHTDPYFNLAAEEYLLKDFTEDIFMLCQNEPSIVIGKHQDVWSEVNLSFAQTERIKIVRRFSGGGAVYHDPGNLNLTFIENGKQLQTDKFTTQIMDFLKSMSVYVETDSRQGLTIGGLKISGSAQSIHKGRIMHHATLLFSSDLDKLTISLQHTPTQATLPRTAHRSTFVKSVPSPVTNISTHIPEPIGIGDFKKALLDYFTANNPGIRNYTFTNSDINSINGLIDGKYATTAWTFNTYTL